MADKKISDMALLSSTDLDADVDYLPIVDPSEPAAADQNKRILVQSIIDNAVNNAQLVSPAQLNPMARAVSVSMTAAASGSNGITVADDDDIDFGTGDFFLHWEGSLPDWTPSALADIVTKRSSGTNYWRLSINTSGGVTFTAVIGGATVINVASSAAVPVIDGAISKITMTIIRETATGNGAASFYCNGAVVGVDQSIAAATTVSLSNAVSLIVCGFATSRTASNTISCIVGNFAPSAAEVLDLCTNGIPDSWKWGSQAAVYAGNYSAGVDGVTTTTGTTLTGNIDGIDGENDWLRIERTGATGNNYCLLPVSGLVGKRVRTSVKIHNAAGSGVSYFYIFYASSPPSASQQVVVAIPDGTTKTLELDAILSRATTIAVAPTDVSGNNVTVATGSIYYVKESFIYKSGATMALLPQDIQYDTGQWFDASSNTGGGMMPATGATVNNKALAEARQVRWTNTWAGTQELQYIGGVNQAILPAKAYIESIIGIVSGATVEDIIVGDGSDTDRYVTITTGLAAGTVTFTLANRTTDGTNLKLTVDPDANATMSIVWTITYRILQ